MRYTLTLFCLIVAFAVNAQTVYKNLCDPNIGVDTLTPTTGGCGYTNGGVTVFTGGNGQDSAVAPFYDCNCSLGSNFANGSPDSWVLFQARSEWVEFKLAPSGVGGVIQNIQLALYEHQGSCFTVKPLGCSKGNQLLTSKYRVIPGNFYAVEIAGGNPTDTGGFRMEVTAFDSCSSCANITYLEAFPSPVLGQYMAGDTVTFHMVVQGWDTSSGVHFHGIAPEFGLGWDLASFRMTAFKLSNDGQGAFVPAINPVNPWPGYYYERYPSIDTTTVDNLGDHDGGNNSLWFFCFKIATRAGTGLSGNSLHVNFNVYNDHQSGSNPNPGCIEDKYFFRPVLNSCNAGGIINSLATEASCKYSCDGGASVQFWGCSFGNDYVHKWYKGFNDSLIANTTGFASTQTGLCATDQGREYILISENQCNSCYYMKAFQIDAGSSDLIVTQLDTGCVDSCDIGMQVVCTSGPSPYTITWQDVIDSLNVHNIANPKVCQGVYNLSVQDGTGCIKEKQGFAFAVPRLPAFFTYPDDVFCSTEGVVAPDFGILGGMFSIPLGIVNDSGEFNTQSLAPPFPQTIYVTSIVGFSTTCTDFHIDSVTIVGSPPSPQIASLESPICLGDKSLAVAVPDAYPTIWWADSLNTVLDQNVDTAVYHPNQTGLNVYYVTNEEVNSTYAIVCQSYPVALKIQVNQGAIEAGPDISSCPGRLAVLQGSGGQQYHWWPNADMDDSTIANPELLVGTQTQWYFLDGIDSLGCYGFDSVLVSVISGDECNEIETYSGITPNGDGQNDRWVINGIGGFEENNVIIFNRWGGKVWEANGYNNRDVAWKGTWENSDVIVPDGTYFYVIDLKNGSAPSTGWVEVTR